MKFVKWIVGFTRINQATGYVDRNYVMVHAPDSKEAIDRAQSQIESSTKTVHSTIFRATFEIRIREPRRYHWWSAWFWKWLLDQEGEYGPTNHQ